MLLWANIMICSYWWYVDKTSQNGWCDFIDYKTALTAAESLNQAIDISCLKNVFIVPGIK